MHRTGKSGELHSMSQFGKKAILDIYDEMELENFAFFRGKELVVSGNSRDDLERWCDRFAMTGGDTLYKFRLYEEGVGQVKAATEYVCSFEVGFSHPGAVGGMGSVGMEILGRLEKLEKNMGGEGKQDTVERLGDAILGWFEEPNKLMEAVGAFKALTSGQPMAAVAGVAEPSRIITPDNEAKVVRLAAILDKLEQHDPMIVEHLQKLLSIAEKQPGTFKTLLGMLEGF